MGYRDGGIEMGGTAGIGDKALSVGSKNGCESVRWVTEGDNLVNVGGLDTDNVADTGVSTSRCSTGLSPFT